MSSSFTPPEAGLEIADFVSNMKNLAYLVIDTVIREDVLMRICESVATFCKVKCKSVDGKKKLVKDHDFTFFRGIYDE